MSGVTSELLALQQTLYTSANPTRRWLHCSRRDWIFAAIERAAAGAGAAGRGRAIEIGPGSGLYLPVLARHYGEVLATDIERSFLDQAESIAREHPNVRTMVDDLTASALPSEHFDLVLCSEVIEHVPDSLPALKTMRRILRPGGTLILSTPLRRSPLEQASRIAFLPGIVQVVRRVYNEPVLKQGHINLLTEPELRAQLGEAGLRVVEHHKTGFYFPLIAEFGGRTGQRLLARIEREIRDSALSQFLWTQYYVATRA
jgi:2-polyprenyl-3-methyl-5-hydroxy-6-metoxy-1,4-benzoquinol methylase